MHYPRRCQGRTYLILFQHLVLFQSFHGIDFASISLLDESDLVQDLLSGQVKAESNNGSYLSKGALADDLDRPEVIKT